ncbi:MAG TPA: tetratricopeptide repeat protein [Xanthobacteraceae bacterium]|nr:tetratricopeptide repeat protein [Xanthobacteraceae bacterium]
MLRPVLTAAVCSAWLAGCATTSNVGDPLTAGQEAQTSEIAPLVAETLPPPETTAAVSAPEISSPVAASEGPPKATPEVLGNDPNDDLSLAKRYFRRGGYGLAEKHFRKAVELQPRDAEAWLGLAAAYDRLRRFDLADRAYRQVIRLIGPTPEVLNNQGFSYMLRGDYRRARQTLLAAKAKSPDNAHIRANLELLAEVQRRAKGVN